MKKHYSIAIPKPCHEDWNKMSPRDKGKFCSSCSKTVVDFTKMNTYEIQDFIHQNKDKRVCGHFKQAQLDSINLHIPSKVLEQRLNFHKLFLLALLITMGTSLMNCTNKNGNSQKIDSIEVIDTLNNNKVLNVLEGLPVIEKIDSVPESSCKSSHNKTKNKLVEEVVIDGLLEIETVGEVAIEEPPINLDSLDIVKPTWCPGPSNENAPEVIVGMLIAQTPPEFKNTPSNLSTQDKRDYLSKGISKIVMDNFNSSVCLDLKGKQKIFVQFQIDTLGSIINIKAQAPHHKLEEEAIRVLKLLPQLVPAKQNNKPIKVVYSLPIIFEIE